MFINRYLRNRVIWQVVYLYLFIGLTNYLFCAVPFCRDYIHAFYTLRYAYICDKICCICFKLFASYTSVRSIPTVSIIPLLFWWQHFLFSFIFRILNRQKFSCGGSIQCDVCVSIIYEQCNFNTGLRHYLMAHALWLEITILLYEA